MIAASFFCIQTTVISTFGTIKQSYVRIVKHISQLTNFNIEEYNAYNIQKKQSI